MQGDSTMADELPAPLSSFIGREQAIVELGQLVGRSRLVTLVGPGGVGKTRLAVEVARTVRGQFAQGVRWIPLASVTDPALLPQVVASALQLSEESRRSPVERLTDAL